jgi:hypothetical protein
VLTSSGIYGFTLTRYLAHVAAITAPAQERAAAADEEVNRQADKVADLTKQIEDLDAAPRADLTSSSRPRTAAGIAAQAQALAAAAKLRLADDQRRQAKRDGLAARRDIETAELAKLRGVRAEVASAQKAAEAEVGPVKLVADVFGVDPGKVVAATVAATYDALCILLLIVSGHKPAVPAAVEAAKPAARRNLRSDAAKRGWETRRRKAKEAAFRRAPVRAVK